MSDDPILSLIRSLGDTLDGLDVALCAFDEGDHALAWNRTFFKFFPEHEGHVYAGEPYHANLRRFYTERLDAQELPNIDRYIAAGVERHRAQTRCHSRKSPATPTSMNLATCAAPLSKVPSFLTASPTV
ncbi:hypothetical protein [Acidovorax sp. Root267]|uniref:hypothetical protein n=1 Tax=Acidovorax sp. Root267 TaxID=1736505 RepID=UPI001F5B0FC6|nr:hypothetical protein [Acidovorax sp. Root267]